MKTLVKNYTFDKTLKQITFTNLTTLDLEQVLLVTNVTDNIIIYNFADPALGGTVSGNILTLAYDTSSMSNSDNLQIFVDVPNYNDLEVLVEVMQDGFELLAYQLNTMKKNQGFPDTSGRLRVNMETGSTLSTVSTVTTLSNITSIDGYRAAMATINMSNMGAKMLRNRILVY